jgi:hypothetical protein
MEMKSILEKWQRQNFPQNYIIRHPVQGFLIAALFSFIFIVIYRPLNAHGSEPLGYIETMAVYCLISGLALYMGIQLLKRIPFFSDKDSWTFFKEIAAIIIILTIMGTAVYFSGFLLEPPADRWNMATFLDALLKSFLIGIIPFVFFTILGYHRWTLINKVHSYGSIENNTNIPEEKIQIQSQLKKEKLGFYPSRLLFAESDGNYVNFYIEHEDKTIKKVIRNSISNIEAQLSQIPWFYRTHRAFIVNIKKVREKQTISGGYRLKVGDHRETIPVSRKNKKTFDEKFHEYHL